MNYGEVRAKFVELTGRDDLVNEDGTDNGADFFIHKGQRHLDRVYYSQKSQARVFKKVESGDYGILFNDCRSVLQVWIANTTGRIELTKKTNDWFRSEYTSVQYQDLDVGLPRYYMLGMFRTQPDMESMSAEDLDAIMGYLDVPMSEGFVWNGILFMPPADGDYMVEVLGYFYSPQLTSNTAENFWTANHPETLIKAALYEMEGFYRNTEGLKDASGFLMGDTVELDKDVVEEEMAGFDMEMEG